MKFKNKNREQRYRIHEQSYDFISNIRCPKSNLEKSDKMLEENQMSRIL